MHRRVFAFLALLALLPLVGAKSPREDRMRAIETRYYIIHTDLNDHQAREAVVRMTRMAEEYADRMRDFGRGGGGIRKRLPFYLYSDPEDYYATGAPRGSAGRFNGNALLAVAEDFGPKTWHIVQHEGFHQFAAAVIDANLPPWVNEGLAEYFGEALFTGDGYITGAIPQWRLERIRKRFKDNEFMPVRDLMHMPMGEWNTALSLANYDQAWSIVHFLAHGEDGRYQRAFGRFMGQLGRGQNWMKAWQNSFGDIRGFEDRWREYWTNLPDNPTADLYAQATVATLTSFVARAVSQQQTFENMDAFAAAARDGELKHHPDDWLPSRLIGAAIKSAENMTTLGLRFELMQPAGAKHQQVQCTLKDGKVLVGTFSVRSGRVASVSVGLARSSIAPSPAPIGR
jgi:hypothetical protein